jgi:hypothetical protein
MQARVRSRAISRRQALVALAVPVFLHQADFATLARQALTEGSLLVRGEADLAGSEMAWRVVQDVAEPTGEAIYQQRALGFTLNSSIFTDLLLTDEATGSAYRLAPDEAAFVSDGTMQRRESLGRDAEAYLRIALVPADRAGDAGGDRMVYAGPPFAAPAGPVTFTLERLQLQAGDRAHTGTGVGQTLILVLQGEIEIEEGEAGPITQLQTVVGSGTSYAAHSTPWGTTITALRDGTIVLLASML